MRREGEGGGRGRSLPPPKSFHIHHARPRQDRLTASDTKTKRLRSFISVSLQRHLALHPHPLLLPPSSGARLPRQVLPPPPHTRLPIPPHLVPSYFHTFSLSVSRRTLHPSHVRKPELAAKRQHKSQDVIKVKLRSRVEQKKGE